MTVDRLIAAAVAVAAALLVALGVGFAIGAFDSGTSGPPGSVSDECKDYALNNAETAGVKDPFIKGVVTIGFNEGTGASQAAVLLKTLGTTYYIPSPYRQTAFICVKAGYENAWVEQMKARDWVEWAHVEGVHPLLTLPH